MIDLLGHVCYFSLVAGQFLLARDNTNGWLFRIVGSGGWTILGVALGLSSIWVWSSVFTITDTYGYMKWKRSNDHQGH